MIKNFSNLIFEKIKSFLKELLEEKLKMSENQNYNINILNALIGNKGIFYKILQEKKGIYLPKLHCKAITNEYLLGVCKKEFFSKQRIEIKMPYFDKKVLKSELYQALKDKLSDKKLSFDILSLPDKN